MAYLEVHQVRKIYQADGANVNALQGVSLTADPGDWIALTGRSGCGKSTLLNLCGAMDFPTVGVVSIGGAITSDLDDNALTQLRRKNIGFIFQSFQLLHTLSVIENVEVPLLLAGKTDARATAAARLNWVGLQGYADRFPHQLSGGQQQRVAIARALVHSPTLILADEPTGNLDNATGESILDLLQRIADESRAVVLMATHSAEFAARANRVLQMRDGRIVEGN
jgi:ABC-type lipoprotein export system ATPase subunit